jgi:hypothetical protein
MNVSLMVFFHLIQKYLKSFARDHVNDVNNNIEGVFEVEAYRAPHTAFLFNVLFDEQVCSNKNDGDELHTHFSFI